MNKTQKIKFQKKRNVNRYNSNLKEDQASLYKLTMLNLNSVQTNLDGLLRQKKLQNYNDPGFQLARSQIMDLKIKILEKKNNF